MSDEIWLKQIRSDMEMIRDRINKEDILVTARTSAFLISNTFLLNAVIKLAPDCPSPVKISWIEIGLSVSGFIIALIWFNLGQNELRILESLHDEKVDCINKYMNRCLDIDTINNDYKKILNEYQENNLEHINREYRKIGIFKINSNQTNNDTTKLEFVNPWNTKRNKDSQLVKFKSFKQALNNYVSNQSLERQNNFSIEDVVNVNSLSNVEIIVIEEGNRENRLRIRVIGTLEKIIPCIFLVIWLFLIIWKTIDIKF